MVFLNLPVADVEAAQAFYLGLGFKRNPVFCDADTACIVVEDNIVLMLLSEAKFRSFIVNDVAARDTTEVLVCLSAASREEVDAIVDAAFAGGAEAWKDPIDMGAMYGRSFRDLDGHVVEVMWMDVQAVTGLSQDDLTAAAV